MTGEDVEHCLADCMEHGLIEAKGSESTDDVEGERVFIEDSMFIVSIVVGFTRIFRTGLGLGMGGYAGSESCGRRSAGHRHRAKTRYRERSAEERDGPPLQPSSGAGCEVGFCHSSVDGRW